MEARSKDLREVVWMPEGCQPTLRDRREHEGRRTHSSRRWTVSGTARRRPDDLWAWAGRLQGRGSGSGGLWAWPPSCCCVPSPADSGAVRARPPSLRSRSSRRGQPPGVLMRHPVSEHSNIRGWPDAATGTHPLRILARRSWLLDILSELPRPRPAESGVAVVLEVVHVPERLDVHRGPSHLYWKRVHDGGEVRNRFGNNTRSWKG